ncbi:hypothetical protein LRS10_01315 [Phenylobacterium sp. J426]|uniref:hypothetical protein n=1 Tax=Phenylobacterium sp. J426 TaxID=2898439 RepID=UPI002150C26F|nr:hypothetical protein [Phenylobacterium sp. J426]MCR5872954.1 hypothetical protein [Phenylobacterium sp. J426]
MGALSPRKIEIVRTLVEAAPDKIVGGLQMALADTGEDPALGSVRELVEVEVHERRLRNTVLQAIAPMCLGDGRDPRSLTFPARVLPLIWRGLRGTAAEEIEEAELAFSAFSPEETSGEAFDHLARIAAYALRSRDYPEFREAAELADAARPDGAEQLAACLELSPVVRRSALRIPEWLASFSEESAAAARLAYKDAVAIAEDAGPRFFEMLAAQMTYPWMVLRIISEVMDKPNERYLADSEMAGFGERLMDEMDESMKAIARLDIDGGPEAGRRAGKLVELITLQVTELETYIDLSRDHGWGHRINKQKTALAGVVEGRIRDAEKYCLLALPTERARLRRIRRPQPRLSLPPDETHVRRATTLLAFVQEVRSSANYGGFAAARSRMLEHVGEYIDIYVEELVDLVKTGDVEDPDRAQAFLGVAADLSLLLRGEKAADLVRRRAAAAANPDAPPVHFDEEDDGEAESEHWERWG